MNNQTAQNSQKKKSSCLVISVIFIFVMMIIFITIPNFLRFSARGVDSEAKQNLGAIFTAYTAYYSDYKTYPSAPYIQNGNTVYNCLSVSEWEPKGDFRYSYKCMDTIVFSPLGENYPGCTACPKSLIYTHADKDSFTVAACSNVDGDKYCNAWTIDDSKKLRLVLDGYSHNPKYRVIKILSAYSLDSNKILKLLDFLFGTEESQLR